MRIPLSVRFFLSAFVVLLICLPGAKISAEAASLPHVKVDLVAEDQWITPGGRTLVAFYFQLERGWHIYWLNPGDSGEPPRVQWRLPAGLSAGEIEWPAPQRLGNATVVDFGYEDTVTLLVAINASRSLRTDQPAHFIADLKVLVCKEVCIPGGVQVSLTLPVKSTPPEVDARSVPLFIAGRGSMPRKPPQNWEFSVRDRKDSFLLTAKVGQPPARALFFPLEESQIDNSAPQKIVLQAVGFELTLRKSDQLLKPIKRLRGVLEISANRAYMIDVAVIGDPGN